MNKMQYVEISSIYSVCHSKDSGFLVLQEMAHQLGSLRSMTWMNTTVIIFTTGFNVPFIIQPLQRLVVNLFHCF